MKMKLRIIISSMVVTGLMLVIGGGAQQVEDPGVLLRAAIEKEEVEGDLQTAIDLYKQIVAKFGDRRTIAAEAQLRIGMCFEKLGLREALKAYEEVLSKFGDQKEFVAKARARLTALRAEIEIPPKDSRLTIKRGPNLDMYAKPSPDGKYFAYVDWITANLAVLDVATGTTRQLTKDGSWGKESGSWAGFSWWSPDSRRVANLWNVYDPKGGTVELRIIPLDENSFPEKVALPEGTIPTWIRGWSLDGSHLLCSISRDSGRTSENMVVDVRNSSIEKINKDLNPMYQLVEFIEEEDTVLFSGPPERGGTHLDIHMGNIKTGESMAIIEHPAQDLLIGILPGTEWLLFASDRRGRLDLWGIPFREGKTDGSAVLIKQGMGRFFPLGFTDDGRYYYGTMSVTDDVFFADFDPETHELVGEPRKLVSPWEGTNMHPVFSPDGKRFAYVTKRDWATLTVHTADTLVVQSLEDEKATPLVIGFDEFPLRRVDNPYWEGTGMSIVLAGWQEDMKELYRVELTSLKKEKILPATEGRDVGDHVCSGESGDIFFSSRGGGYPETITRMDANGRNHREWFRAEEGQRISSLGLSPDEETLSIIVHLDQSRRGLLLLPVVGGAPLKIHEFVQRTGGGVSHGWAPDGESIYYVVREEEPTQMGIHRIELTGKDVTETVLKYKGLYYGIEFHPGGRMLAFTGRSGASSDAEVWVMENLREELERLTKDKDGN